MKKSILIFLMLTVICMGISYLVTNLNSNNENIESDDSTQVNYDSLFSSELNGDEWPNTDFTKEMPKPIKGTLSMYHLGKSSMSFEVSAIEKQDYYNYIEIAKEKGFTLNQSESHGYRALNDDDYVIEIFYSNNVMTVYISY